MQTAIAVSSYSERAGGEERMMETYIWLLNIGFLNSEAPIK